MAKTFNCINQQIDSSWYPFFSKPDVLKEVYKVHSIIHDDKKNSQEYHPVDYFEIFRLVPLHSIRVVFIGQEPYPNSGNATGIAFCVDKEVDVDELEGEVKSIKVMLKASGASGIIDGNVHHWFKQGVFMFNVSLTYDQKKSAGNRSGHDILWRPFITKLLTFISDNTNSIFVFFSVRIYSIFNSFINKDRSMIIAVSHPSTVITIKDSWKVNPFEYVNDMLIPEIIW